VIAATFRRSWNEEVADEPTVTMKRAPRSGLVEFRPRARLLKLIGAELISDDVLASPSS